MSLLDKASLIVTPNAYKESKLYSVVPNTTLGDMDVVRATTATRVNSAGLVEVVPRNLLTYSEDFSNTIWTKTNASITSNVAISPNGMQTADKLVENTSNASHYTNQAIPNQNSLLTYSVYAKKAERDFLFVNAFATLPNNFTYSPFAYFNLSNGTVGTVSNCNASILNVGNGWYRCIIQCTTIFAQTSANVAFYNYVSIANNTNSYLGDGTSGIFIWGAQVENFATATEYFPTTTRLNIPRIDYTNGSCPSLLVEPQRTNLTLYSEQFDNAYWIKDIDVTVNSNVSISPSGNLDADRVNFASNNKAIYKNITATGTHRFSIYLKGEGSNIGKQIQLLIGNVGGTVNVTLTSQWQRFTTDASTSTYVGVAKIGALQADSVLIWGSQLESGSYATSYIPTVASTVTRNADVISKTGISSLIGQTEGVLFTDFVCNGFQNYGTPLSVNNSSTSNNIWITTFANGNIRAELYNGAVQASIIYTGGVIGQRYKLAFAYKTNDFAMYVNGSLVGTDVSGTTFSGTTLSRLDFDLGNSALYSLSLIKVNQVILFPNRLTNSELAQLTTI